MPQTISRRLKAELERLVPADAAIVRAFFERELGVRDSGDLRRWLIARVDRFIRLEEADAATRAHLLRGREAYRILTGRRFEPEGFAHRSLSAKNVLLLVELFGTREAFRDAVRHGRLANREIWYAAWLHGFISNEGRDRLPPLLHTKREPEKRRGRRTTKRSE